MNPTIRSADPAATLDIRASSAEADEMLREILSTPRVEARPARRRLGYAAAATGVAAAAAVALPVFWPGSSGPGAAYAVERRADGSVDVSVDFDRFNDPKALQRALDEQDIPAVVLSGPSQSRIGPDGKLTGPVTVPACARYTPYGSVADEDDPDYPLAFSSSGRFDDTSLVLRPRLLPDDGTYVIKIVRNGGKVEAFSGGVALGDPPSCMSDAMPVKPVR